MIDRRAFLRASLAVTCAPMIVRASSLMRLPMRQARAMAVAGDYYVVTYPIGPEPAYYVIYDGVQWRRLTPA